MQRRRFIPKDCRRWFESFDDYHEVTGDQLQEVADATGKDVWDVLKYWIVYLRDKNLIAIE